MTRFPISAIIPSFNHGGYIAEAIESVLDQSVQPAEIIVVDDNSSDNSMQVINKYQKNVRIIRHMENLGGAAALNTGLKESKQEYVAILNSDDVWKSEKIARQSEYMKAHNLFLSFTTAQIIDTQSNVIGNPDRIYDVFKITEPHQNSYLNHFFTFGNFLCHPTLFAKRDIFNDTNGYNNKLVQLPDFYQWIHFAKKYEIGILNEKLTQYRYVPGLNTSDQSSTRTRTVSRNELFYIFDSFFDGISNQKLMNEFENIILGFSDKLKHVAEIDLGAALLLSQENGALKSQSTMAAMNRLWKYHGAENEILFKQMVSSVAICYDDSNNHHGIPKTTAISEKIKHRFMRILNN
jgi:glycosyltransferase involved in cell wall biosynthesis